MKHLKKSCFSGDISFVNDGIDGILDFWHNNSRVAIKTIFPIVKTITLDSRKKIFRKYLENETNNT